MQVQENNGRYREPGEFDGEKLEDLLEEKSVKRVVVFPAYDEDGKPSKEMRRAWRRWLRTRELSPF